MEYSASSKSERASGVHVLVLPFSAQGHLGPMMKLVHRLADHGIKITILTNQTAYSRLVEEHSRNEVTIVLVPDGLEDNERKGLKMMDSFFEVMPPYTLNFINNVNNQPQNDQKVTCIISDVLNFWSLEIPRKIVGLKLAVFSPVSYPGLAAWLKASELLEAGIIDDHQGCSYKKEEILLSPYLPPLGNHDHPWTIPGDLLVQKKLFEIVRAYEQYHRGSDWVIGNWFHNLDPSMDDLHPNILSIGPLIESGRPSGGLWPQDMSCLSWLDKQPPRSVVYVAFGSTGKKSKQQFDELALGLELVGRSFLWVVKTDPADGVATVYPDGFRERVVNLGKMVDWAPQEQVLAHPSVACFINHCGWNSIMESMSYGIPMLCWPFFSDHSYCRTCVCYGWKIGVELKADENGVVSRHQIKIKVDELLSNPYINSNVLKLSRLAHKSISKGGSSFNNLESFVSHLKQLKV